MVSSDYVARMQFYLQTHFTCEYTGKTGLTYFEAAASEEHESQSTQFKFPDPLKPRVLQSAQFRTLSFCPSCFVVPFC